MNISCNLRSSASSTLCLKLATAQTEVAELQGTVAQYESLLSDYRKQVRGNIWSSGKKKLIFCSLFWQLEQSHVECEEMTRELRKKQHELDELQHSNVMEQERVSDWDCQPLVTSLPPHLPLYTDEAEISAKSCRPRRLSWWAKGARETGSNFVTSFIWTCSLPLHQTTQGRLQEAQERLEVYEHRNSDQVKLLAELTTKVKKKTKRACFPMHHGLTMILNVSQPSGRAPDCHGRHNQSTASWQCDWVQNQCRPTGGNWKVLAAHHHNACTHLVVLCHLRIQETTRAGPAESWADGTHQQERGNHTETTGTDGRIYPGEDGPEQPAGLAACRPPSPDRGTAWESRRQGKSRPFTDCWTADPAQPEHSYCLAATQVQGRGLSLAVAVVVVFTSILLSLIHSLPDRTQAPHSDSWPPGTSWAVPGNQEEPGELCHLSEVFLRLHFQREPRCSPQSSPLLTTQQKKIPSTSNCFILSDYNRTPPTSNFPNQTYFHYQIFFCQDKRELQRIIQYYLFSFCISLLNGKADLCIDRRGKNIYTVYGTKHRDYNACLVLEFIFVNSFGSCPKTKNWIPKIILQSVSKYLFFFASDKNT